MRHPLQDIRAIDLDQSAAGTFAARTSRRTTMKNMLATLLALTMLAGTGIALAAGHATAEQAVSLVKAGVAYIQANGEENALKEFNDPNGKFRKGELYITVYDMHGTSLANGSNTRLVGKNMMELRDADGVYIIRERIKLVNASGHGWLDFKWPNPVTRNIEQKSMYSEKAGDVIVSCGIYK